MISGVGSSATSVAGTNQNGNLGKQDFLKLLVTQLKAQDPMNPQDGTEFVAQLAQFTSLERLVNIEDGVGNMTMATLGTNATMASSFIGKTVRVAGESFQYDGSNGKIDFTLEKGASTVTIEVLGKDGQVIDTIDAPNLEAGTNSVKWDGVYHDANGNDVHARPGKHSFRVTAKDDKGNDVSVRTESLVEVKAVHFSGSGVPELVLSDGRTLALSEVTEVMASAN